MLAPELIAFIDESGSLPDPSDVIVVIAAVVAHARDLGLARLLAMVRRQLPDKGKRKRERKLTELKFHETSDATRRKILSALTKQDVTLFIVVVDKAGSVISDTPNNYATLIEQVVPYCLERFPRLRRVFIDRHFTRSTDEAVLRKRIESQFDEMVDLRFVNSSQETRIDLADFVAGAVAYTQRFDDTRYEELIRSEIAVYRVLRWKEKEKW